MTGNSARSFVPEMEARRAVLDGVTGWEGLSAERAAVWDAPFGPLEEWDLVIADGVVEGPHGPVPIRTYRPPTEQAGRPALVWCHGGGFVGGDLDMPEGHEVARGLAGRADAVVVSVDYRLCPLPSGLDMGLPAQPTDDGDVRFPIPHDDALAAYRWTREHAAELGIDASLVAIGGASAGANIAAGVALHLRDDGAGPWQVLLAYPVLHPTMPAPSTELAEAIALTTPAVLRFPPELCAGMSANYLGGPIDSATPYAFAGLSDDLTGFPPTLIDNDEFDDLRCSGEAFTVQLRDAGVDVEQVTTLGVPHGHLNKIGFGPTQASLDRMAARLTAPRDFVAGGGSTPGA